MDLSQLAAIPEVQITTGVAMSIHAFPSISRPSVTGKPLHLTLPVDPASCALPIRQAWRDRARVKATMKRWNDLSHLFRTEDAKRSTAPDWMPVTLLLAMGARDALQEAGSLSKVPTVEIIERLMANYPSDYVPALLAALGHIDLGQSLRGTVPASSLSPDRDAAYRAHIDRAAEIVDVISRYAPNSAAVATARCAVLPASSDPTLGVRAEFKRLIDLDPTNPMHMRGLGTYLLPRWFGSHDRIEEEARKTMDRTRGIWGRGAYAWVWMDALALDEEAAATMNPELFLEGVHDILARAETPREANLWAAFAGITMRPEPCERPGRASDNRARLHKAFRWIMLDHVSALHPAYWSEALHRLSPCDTAMRRLRRSTLPSRDSMGRFVQSLPQYMPEGFGLQVLMCEASPVQVQPRRLSRAAKH
ncbi:hypothetical protein [Mesobacterium pallidum]|uniref:hypothetical protein n=1 Tax=Mesobacterium pallidum TaxID=2872037 RepID=UPI001EE2DADC|nr:hypothetical protein [Mesobacterium pallidum]